MGAVVHGGDNNNNNNNNNRNNKKRNKKGKGKGNGNGGNNGGNNGGVNLQVKSCGLMSNIDEKGETKAQLEKVNLLNQWLNNFLVSFPEENIDELVRSMSKVQGVPWDVTALLAVMQQLRKRVVGYKSEVESKRNAIEKDTMTSRTLVDNNNTPVLPHAMPGQAVMQNPMIEALFMNDQLRLGTVSVKSVIVGNMSALRDRINTNVEAVPRVFQKLDFDPQQAQFYAHFSAQGDSMLQNTVPFKIDGSRIDAIYPVMHYKQFSVKYANLTVTIVDLKDVDLMDSLLRGPGAGLRPIKPLTGGTRPLGPRRAAPSSSACGSRSKAPRPASARRRRP